MPRRTPSRQTSAKRDARPSSSPHRAWVIVAVVAFGAGTWAFVGERQKKTAARDVAWAEDLMAHGDLARAVGVLEDMRQRGLDPPDRRIVLAVAYGKMNDPRALAAAKEATETAPDSLRAHMALLTAYTRVYDKPNALAELRVAERLAPRNNTELCLFGAGYAASSHDYGVVEEQARRCVAIDPRLAQAWYYLGLALGQSATTTAWAEAETSLQKSTALAGDSYPAWLELGSVEIQLGRDVEAVNSLERARTIGTSVVSAAGSTRQQLQDVIRIDHLLSKAYHRRGMAAQEAEMRRECDTLNERVQRLPAT
jgi:tetratricopeptide (TPR) repeat protein